MIMAAALQAVEPGTAVQKFLHRNGKLLNAGQQSYDLSKIRRVFLVGAGKAGIPMGYAAAQLLGDKLYDGLIITKDGYGELPAGWPSQVRLVYAAHPVPDERGAAAAGSMKQLLQAASEDDLVVCVISGGGSALMADPLGDIRLSDLQDLTSRLLASGASIQEINTIRKHLSYLKAGRLAELASPAMVLTLILSDVVGDPLDMIASGPTVPDPTTYGQALAILERYRLVKEISHAVLKTLQRGVRGELEETPKPGSPIFQRVQNVIVASNAQAAQAARQQAEQEGYYSLLLTNRLTGEASRAGLILAAIGRQLVLNRTVNRPICLIAGGETVVTLRGKGKGGRNQEMALAAVQTLAGIEGIGFITLATDGGDGPTDAAGAVVTGETYRRAQAAGLDPQEYLRQNNAYPFFARLGDLLKPGPTQTNVNDLAFLISA